MVATHAACHLEKYLGKREHFEIVSADLHDI